MTVKERYETETVSHSGLSCLEISPIVYRNYKKREDKTSSKGKDLGTAIHCLILENQRFKDEYLVSAYPIPTGKYATFVKLLYETQGVNELSDEEKEYWITTARNRAELSATPEKCWEKFCLDTDLQRYWNYLQEAENKFQLSVEDKKAADAGISSAQRHCVANELLFGSALSDTYNELDIIWTHPLFKFKCRSIIDRLIIDTFTMTITIVDLKTTSKNVHTFIDAYERYKYTDNLLFIDRQ